MMIFHLAQAPLPGIGSVDKSALEWETQGGVIETIQLVKWVISMLLAFKLKKNLTISPNQSLLRDTVTFGMPKGPNTGEKLVTSLASFP